MDHPNGYTGYVKCLFQKRIDKVNRSQVARRVLTDFQGKMQEGMDHIKECSSRVAGDPGEGHQQADLHYHQEVSFASSLLKVTTKNPDWSTSDPHLRSWLRFKMSHSSMTRSFTLSHIASPRASEAVHNQDLVITTPATPVGSATNHFELENV